MTGEIHSDWREVITKGVADKNLPVTLTSPNTSHEDSDDCGAIVLGMEEERPNWDKIGANMNNIRTKTLIKDADVVVVRFGEKYRQWNAAFDAGYAAALGKSIITLHPVGQVFFSIWSFRNELVSIVLIKIIVIFFLLLS